MTAMEHKCDPVFARVDKLISLLHKSKLLHILMVMNNQATPMRFSEIKKRVDSSPTTVNRRLIELEQNGLVIREVINTAPVTVQYTLTNEASSLAPAIQSMYDWIVEKDIHLL